MAQTVLEKIQVSELSKFGFKVGDEYINYSKQLNDSDRALVVPGASFEAELYVADSGKRYLNKIVSKTSHVEAPTKAAVSKTSTTPKVTPKSDEAMTRADWDAKDRRISRQGVIQAAVQAVAGFSTMEDVFDNATLLAAQMLKFVNEKGE
jgi:hypothetical protein